MSSMPHPKPPSDRRRAGPCGPVRVPRCQAHPATCSMPPEASERRTPRRSSLRRSPADDLAPEPRARTPSRARGRAATVSRTASLASRRRPARRRSISSIVASLARKGRAPRPLDAWRRPRSPPRSPASCPSEAVRPRGSGTGSPGMDRRPAPWPAGRRPPIEDRGAASECDARASRTAASSSSLARSGSGVPVNCSMNSTVWEYIGACPTVSRSRIEMTGLAGTARARGFEPPRKRPTDHARPRSRAAASIGPRSPAATSRRRHR